MSTINGRKQGVIGLDEKDLTTLGQIIEKNRWTILGCGTPLTDFATHAKNQIMEHYKQFPDEKFVNIIFEKMNLGNDNWSVNPVFFYDKITNQINNHAC